MDELLLYGGIGLGVVVFLVIIIIVTRQKSVKKNSSNINENILLDNILTRIISLRDIYYDGYEFPDWNTDLNVFRFVYPELAKETLVYYNRSEVSEYKEKEALGNVVKYREPCNIEMNRLYDKNKLLNEFGWENGYYGKYYDEYGVLAPNFGIYCKTPVAYKKLTNLKNLKKNIIHLYNAIGYAFDNDKQPDYKYFIENNKQDELIEKYKKIFQLILQCAKEKKLNTIVMSAVGANNFAKLYKDNDFNENTESNIQYFQRTKWVPAFLEVFKDIQDIQGIKIKFMGMKKEYVIINELLKNNIDVKKNDIGFFPDNIKEVQIENTLFVNAWDPWSIVGNGNSGDYSLDGYIGRSTFAGPLTFPSTNPYFNPSINPYFKLNEQQAKKRQQNQAKKLQQSGGKKAKQSGRRKAKQSGGKKAKQSGRRKAKQSGGRKPQQNQAKKRQ